MNTIIRLINGLICIADIALLFENKNVFIFLNFILRHLLIFFRQYCFQSKYLEFVHLIGLANAEASTLSYGQLKLLELAQVLMHSPKLLLLDEPFAGINPGLIDKIIQHLRDLNKQGMTIVLIEHNLPMVASLCDSIAVVSNGIIEIVGPPDVVVNNPRVKEVFLGG